MKIATAICLFLLGTAIHAQEKEIEDFKKEFNFYIDFQLNKFDSIPINTTSQKLYSKKVDLAFKTFVAQPNSDNYDKLILAKDNTKFFRLDPRFSIHVKSFTINDIVYAVYSYTSQSKSNYIVKNINSNEIVYQGSSNKPYVDALYLIDKQHFLLIEKNGDFNSSRRAIVLSAEKKDWKTISAFKGYDLDNNFKAKKLLQKRSALSLECDMEITMLAPKDVNLISFDSNTKTISYKQYESLTKFKTIAAKWENNKFEIDDYRVQNVF
ncbi:hypothetical protein [Flavobacterium sp. '19STA2R22 D10 B1']|uniref:hypothetical protein n=1 Tax=Flavobacterium aerium TaxID=3037261 RepID=UPI00278C2FA4|nr:hypothetical protein [Flavobacterium sp. '19STA2R22 D10 B1']